jgi:hypothetical protein
MFRSLALTVLGSPLALEHQYATRVALSRLVNKSRDICEGSCGRLIRFVVGCVLDRERIVIARLVVVGADLQNLIALLWLITPLGVRNAEWGRTYGASLRLRVDMTLLSLTTNLPPLDLQKKCLAASCSLLLTSLRWFLSPLEA